MAISKTEKPILAVIIARKVVVDQNEQHFCQCFFNDHY